MRFASVLLLLNLVAIASAADPMVVVRPKEIDDVLVNPGIGFTEFKSFSQDGAATQLAQRDYPDCSIKYIRPLWSALEPQRGEYQWEIIDKALATAHARGQTVMLRAEPYATVRVGRNTDVPGWYRALVGEEKTKRAKWRTDPENPLYVECFGNFIRAFGKRYDGNPDLESVDLGIVGAWGEGDGSSLLTDKTRNALVDAYVESFKKTPLVAMLMDEKTNKYALSQGVYGWRADCLGDMGGFNPAWSHMQDKYPESIIQYGLADAWKKGPVEFEACWVMEHWKEHNWDVNYIVDQSLKWHISSFNAKSSPVPAEWWPAVNRWLKHMGYRFVLRRFIFPAEIHSNSAMKFSSWWENKGVAPIYKPFAFAIRLEGNGKSQVVLTDADIRTWLPGDAVCDGAIEMKDLPAGEYSVSVGIVDPVSKTPKVKLAIEGVQKDGWYLMGKTRVGSASADANGKDVR